MFLYFYSVEVCFVILAKFKPKRRNSYDYFIGRFTVCSIVESFFNLGSFYLITFFFLFFFFFTFERLLDTNNKKKCNKNFRSLSLRQFCALNQRSKVY